MNYLLIDTTKKKFVIALSFGGAHDTYISRGEAGTSDELLSAVQAVLDKNKCGIADIDVLAGVVGPGSFTGIRIGVATILGLGFCHNAKYVCVNSLELAAYNNNAGQKVMSVLPCVGGWYYAAEYEGKTEISAPKAYIKEELSARVSAFDGKIAGDASGLDLQGKQLLKFDINNYFAIMEDRIGSGGFCVHTDLVPMYLRKSQAEENRR